MRFIEIVKKIINKVFVKLVSVRLALDIKTRRMAMVDNDTACHWIVFSKDRVMQLHAFLSSFFEKVDGSFPVTVLYTFSSSRHEKSYDDLSRMFGAKVKFIKETSFRRQLIDLVSSVQERKIIFFCDDGVVVEDVSLESMTKYNPRVIMGSLLRGMDWTYCFAYAKDQALPGFKEGVIDDSRFLVWRWGEATESPDWSYPLSVGGHIFSKDELLLILKSIKFKAPNSLEGNMQAFKPLFLKRYGICFRKTQLGSVPVNIVNTEIVDNLITGEYSADELLEKWESGLRIKHEVYYGKNALDIYSTKMQFVDR